MPDSPRICADCPSELRARQQSRCTRCAAAYRQRERRRKILERNLLGPSCEIDDVVLRAIDVDDLCARVDDAAVWAQVRDHEIVTYRGVVETERIIAECLLETEHRQQHISAPGLCNWSNRRAV